MKFAKGVVKSRVIILIVAISLMIPCLYGMLHTRINYDMLTYLPKTLDTGNGQDRLMEDFGKGAFSFVVIEGMNNKDVSALAEKIRGIDHVETVLWYDSFMDVDIPMEMLPDKVYDLF
ncbi:MAG: hypothetical protein J6Y09_07270, partial [Lachnospiraceae bacterium]|nr:hypothetical protein [Lachnospiraceae bacterium]